MGINVNGLRFLLHARASGVDFTRTVMIGRQGLHLSFKRFCQVFRKEFRYDIGTGDLEELFNHGFGDGLLRLLGAETVDSMDYSAFEGATHTHDLNTPVPINFHGKYTAVVEGGTLEHVFNLPTAIQNCMEMVAVGGHYLGMAPINNYMGHGFYQFSPEFFFRVFSPENGYRVERMLLHAGREAKNWYTVPDPLQYGIRIDLRSRKPLLLLVLASRTADCPIFRHPPLQSDYEAAYGGESGVSANGAGSNDIDPRRIAFLKKNFRSILRNHRLNPLLRRFEFRIK